MSHPENSSPHGGRITAGLAIAVRVVTVPSLLALLLILALACLREDIFRSPGEILLTICSLTVLPLLAYPITRGIPALHRKGREFERTLAMILSALGYTGSFLYGLISGCTVHLRMVFATYFFSVVGILFCNKVLHFRASGHGCGVTGPAVLACRFLCAPGQISPGWFVLAAVLTLALWGASLWASLVTRRHTLREFLAGTAVCLVAFALSLALWH